MKENPYEAPRMEAERSPRPTWLERGLLVMIAALLIFLAGWQASHSIYGELRWLAGPIALVRTRSSVDFAIGAALVAFLLPLVVAAVFRPTVLGVVVSTLAVLAWLTIGFQLELWASC